MKKIKLMMAVLLAAISGYSATLIDVNFEGDTVGARPASPPSGSVTFSPTSANVPGANSITVIGSPANTAGTGSGVELVDNSAVSTRWEYELSISQSVIRWDFSFSPLASSGRVSGSRLQQDVGLIPKEWRV